MWYVARFRIWSNVVWSRRIIDRCRCRRDGEQVSVIDDYLIIYSLIRLDYQLRVVIVPLGNKIDQTFFDDFNKIAVNSTVVFE